MKLTDEQREELTKMLSKCHYQINSGQFVFQQEFFLGILKKLGIEQKDFEKYRLHFK